MMIKMSGRLRSIRKNEDGAAAMEFVLMAPFLFTLFLGVVEIGNMTLAYRKAQTVTSASADLVAQALEIEDADMNDIFSAVNSILDPFDPNQISVRISSISINLDDTVEVGWSDGLNTTALNEGDDFTLPSSIGLAGGSVIVSETELAIEPITFIGEMIFGDTVNIPNEYFIEPRRALRIPRVRE